MRTTPLMALILIALLSVIFSAATAKRQTAPTKTEFAAQSPDTSADADTIGRIIIKYAESIDAADTALASQIWWDSPEVSFIHPLGHEHGFDQIKANVYTRLMAETFSERKLTPRDITIHVYGDAAWAEFYWDFNAKFRKDGKPITTHGRETQIYRKMQGNWRIIHVHYSGMPATQPGQGF
ncbi:MAG TPA: nuclear transport factor 2 family protein [Candidatus Acidoferrum sp.]